MNFISVGEGLGLVYGSFEKGGGLELLYFSYGREYFLCSFSVTLCTIIVNGNNFCSELELT